MNTISNYVFSYTMDDTPEKVCPDGFPLSELPEIEELCEVTIDGWDEDTLEVFLAGCAPAICLALALSKEMAEQAYGIRSDQSETSNVQLFVRNPDGDVLYRSGVFEVTAVPNPDDASIPLVGLDYRKVTGNIANGTPFTGEVTPEQAEKLSYHYPTSERIAEKFGKLDQRALLDITALLFAVTGGLADVIRQNIS